jgi:hypothetical protein
MESWTKLEEDTKKIPQAGLSYEYVEITKWSNANRTGRKFIIQTAYLKYKYTFDLQFSICIFQNKNALKIILNALLLIKSWF